MIVVSCTLGILPRKLMYGVPRAPLLPSLSDKLRNRLLLKTVHWFDRLLLDGILHRL